MSFGRHRLHDGVEDTGHLVLAALELGVTGEVEQAVDDALDLDDAGQNGTRHFLRQRAAAKLSRREEVCRHLDAAEGVSDLVGDPRRHLAQRGQLLTLDEPALRLDLLGEVAEYADGADDQGAAFGE